MGYNEETLDEANVWWHSNQTNRLSLRVLDSIPWPVQHCVRVEARDRPGSVDILKERRRCFNRYRLKLNPSSRACRICMGRDRPGARAESFRFTEENRLSIRARRR